jgi:hypothetical protein
MKASELRIGNIVRYGANNRVLDAELFLQLLKYTTPFDPIPLTEERLLKFGFEHEDDYLELQINEHLSIIYVGYLALMIDGVIIQVNNTNSDKVHQLQNLYFALTGEELKQQEQ